MLPSTDRQTARSLLIVAREHINLIEILQRELAGHSDIHIILDRRSRERRQRDLPVTGQERRRGERRSMSSPETDLHRRSYLLTRPRYRRPNIASD